MTSSRGNLSKKKTSSSTVRRPPRGRKYTFFVRPSFLGEHDVESEEQEPEVSYNFREELIYLFFTSAIEHIIESREPLVTASNTPINTSDSPVKTDTVIPSSTEDVKDIPETEANMSQIKIAKLKKNKQMPKVKLQKSSTKEQLTRSRSNISINEDLNIKSPKLDPTSAVSLQDWQPANKGKKEKKDIDWMVKCEDKVEKIVFKNGNVYEGETSKWLMHGKGTFRWADRTIYEGHFENAYTNGRGKMILPDLSIYEGDFRRGLFNGEGIFSLTSTPSVYKGSWKNGKRHGFGWYLYEQDNYYEGEWFENKKHGLGYRKYKNGIKYKGMWLDGKKNGEGSMLWENNDFYTGQWKNNKPHGYGEYTWNIRYTDEFVFPLCTWYKGTWSEGIRNGIGILNFGTESGAKLVGTWHENQKHGPGLMICGNGLTLQCNPIFFKDKAVHLDSVVKTLTEKTEDKMDQYEEKIIGKKFQLRTIIDDKTAYRKMVKQIYSKVPTQQFDLDVMQMLTENGMKISEKRYIRSGYDRANSQMYCPLEIPIHTVAEEVDLDFFITTIWSYYFPNNEDTLNDIPGSVSEINETTIRRGKQQSNKSLICNKANEEKILRNQITVYLPKLQELYNQYAAAMSREKPVKYKVVLIRLFFWQLLRDADLPRNGVALVEVDEFLAKNPRCCLESDHSPFETIYFWQFIQGLLGSAWLLHLVNQAKKNQGPSLFARGTTCHIFKQFLDEHIFQNSGKFVGVALTEFRDLVPIKYMHSIYLNIGEPHSVFDFLYFTCTKDGSQPLCYSAIDYGDRKPKKLNEGTNVTISDKILYVEARTDLVTRRYRQRPNEKPTDMFFKTLYTFRSLGRKNIIKLLHKVCPLAVIRGKLQLDYKLTFLEFYETVLLCAYAKAEQRRKFEEVQLKQEFEAEQNFKNVYQSSTMSKLGHKRKKQKGSYI